MAKLANTSGTEDCCYFFSHESFYLGAPGFLFFGVAELGYDTGKNTRGEPKMISGILMGNWHISKF
jgi:hypothetical protein